MWTISGSDPRPLMRAQFMSGMLSKNSFEINKPENDQMRDLWSADIA